MQTPLQQRSPQKLYPFDRGWRILRFVIEALRTRFSTMYNWCVHKVQHFVDVAATRHWFVRYWIYTGIVGMVIFAVILCAEMMLTASILLVLYLFSLAIWAAIDYIIIGFLALGEWIYKKFYAFFFCCPHCHKEMSLPNFRCNVCGVEQQIPLTPNLYGILSHQCESCRAALPTLDRGGRDALQRLCANPHCKRPLHEGIGKGSNIHIPLVGGIFVGKTNYMVMALNSCKNILETNHGYDLSFPDEQDQRRFENNIRQLEKGRELVKTPDSLPSAYNIIIKPRQSWLPKFPKLLYMYDAQGEVFNNEGDLSRQEYYRYTKGIIFIIDPFSIPQYYHSHQAEIDSMRDLLRPSDLSVEDTYGRLKETFENYFSVLRRGGRYSQPVAVVVNKVDALHLEDEIGEPAANKLMSQSPSIRTQEEAIDFLVKEFLNRYNLGNFVREIEAHFNVRYFSCSALGRLPVQSDTTSFQPIRVYEPLAWILKQTKAIKL